MDEYEWHRGCEQNKYGKVCRVNGDKRLRAFSCLSLTFFRASEARLFFLSMARRSRGVKLAKLKAIKIHIRG